MYGNPFRDLNDIPDNARLGVKLMLSGVGVGFVRWAWPRASAASFQRASAAFMRAEPYLPHRSYGEHHWAISDFGVFLIAIACLVFFCGAYVFLRRGFWWVAENRSDPEFTEIKLK